MIKMIKGGVTAAKGFCAASTAAGIKYQNRQDMAMLYSEEEATKILSEPEVTAIADIKMGTEEATAWGCDLTYDYVKINADYRS